MYFWKNNKGKGFSGPVPIDTRNYYYNLEVGQKLKTIRFEGSNKEMYVHPVVLEISNDGIMVKDIFCKTVFVPWKKELPNAGIYEMRDMYIEPCEFLFEDNKLEEILAGNIETETYKDGKWLKSLGSGIWYHNGNRSNYSYFSGNLKNFVPKQERLI